MPSSHLINLARDYTRKSSLQTYFIIRYLADRNRVGDAFMAYAYFRWLDNQIDMGSGKSNKEKALINRQKKIIEMAYRGEPNGKLSYEEEMVCTIIKADTDNNPRLKSYIDNFLAIIVFDSKRKGKIVGAKQLKWYSETIGKAVTDCILYFVGHDADYRQDSNLYKAATAAHIVHTLRDFEEDLELGFINVPREYYAKHKLKNRVVGHDYRDWIAERVSTAKRYFAEGREYIDSMPWSRCKLAALLYCYRFYPHLKRFGRLV